MNGKSFCTIIVFAVGTLPLAGMGFAQAPPPLNATRSAPEPRGFPDSSGVANPYGNPMSGGFASSSGLQPEPVARMAAAPTGGPSSGYPSSAAGSPGESTGSPADSISTNNFFAILREGGVLMIPILFCSFVLVVFIFERLLYLRRGRVIPRPFVRGVIEQLEQQQLDQDEALELCEQNGSPIAELFAAALKKWNRPAVEMEQAVVDAGAHITSKLRRYLRLFNAISNLTPLLGLLGTVLGMIDAFNSIAQADAMGKPELLASGIGAALLTTAGGLCVAIPAYTAYVFFLGKTDKLILELDSLVANVVELTCAEAQQNSRSRNRSRKAA